MIHAAIFLAVGGFFIYPWRADKVDRSFSVAGALMLMASTLLFVALYVNTENKWADHVACIRGDNVKDSITIDDCDEYYKLPDRTIEGD